ncbi:MAG: acetamidase/formamidase family protein [Acidobacteriota bacterium]|nr:MAG: acetamidase/formamidase family protein [Acidobacteriota bacterium]
MNRKTFLSTLGRTASSMALLPFLGCAETKPPTGEKMGLGSSALIGRESAQEGLRRLASERSFTVFQNGIEPAYRVELDEVILVETQHGLPGRVTREGTFRESRPDEPVNPMTGPIFVEGIEPGDALGIDLLEIRVNDWGYAGGRVFELSEGYAHFDDRLRLPLSPMLGGIGIVPAEGQMDTRTPCDTGGNMDCKEVRAGSTLVFTAQVQGALVGLGDAHALQGDGEVRGQGIECDSETLLRFRKLPRPLSPRPVILRPEFVATMGAHEDLNEAAWQATGDMIQLIVDTTGREKEEAYALVNLVGNLKINQIVDPWKGARMEVPNWVFGV